MSEETETKRLVFRRLNFQQAELTLNGVDISKSVMAIEIESRAGGLDRVKLVIAPTVKLDIEMDAQVTERKHQGPLSRIADDMHAIKTAIDEIRNPA